MLDKTLYNKLAFTTSLKAAAALTIAATIAFYFHYTLFWWAIFITFVSIQPDIGSSIMMMIARLSGTIGGALFGIVMAQLFQYPWVYYPGIFIFIFCTFYYVVKFDISWAGFLCVVTGVVVTLLGPMYEQGIFYYAIERCFQIIFAILVVSLVLLVLKGQYAHQILREKIELSLIKYKKLWERITQDFLQGKCKDEIQTMVREISIDLVEMEKLLRFSKYEIWKKNFNDGQCLSLLRLLRKLLAILSAVNEVTRYVSASDFSQEVQDFAKKLDAVITKSLTNLASLTNTKAQKYDPKIDEIENEFHQLMEQRLAHHIQAQTYGNKMPLHRIAWFSLVARMLHVMAFMRKVIVLMNSNKVNLKLQKQLESNLLWVKGVHQRQMRLNVERIKLAFHGAMSAAIIIFFQQYFHLSPMISMFAVITALFISISLIMPLAGNIGLGIVGVVLGFFYSYLSSIVLNYYPNLAIVLLFLFAGTVIAAYCMILSKMQNRSFLIFAIYFALSVIYTLTQPAETRANFDMPLILILGILVTTIIYSFVSKFLFPINYKQLLRKNLQACLQGTGKLLLKLSKTKTLNTADLQIAIYQQRELVNQARLSIHYCKEDEIYGDTEIQKIYEVSYSCELMQMACLNILHSMNMLSQNGLIEELSEELKNSYRNITHDIFYYAKCIRNNDWNKKLITDANAIKRVTNQVFDEMVPKILQQKNCVKSLRAAAIIYNAMHRMADVQHRLLSFKGFKF